MGVFKSTTTNQRLGGGQLWMLSVLIVSLLLTVAQLAQPASDHDLLNQAGVAVDRKPQTAHVTTQQTSQQDATRYIQAPTSDVLVQSRIRPEFKIRSQKDSKTSSSVPTNEILFTPELVKQRRLQEYVNLPAFPVTAEMEAAVQRAIDRPAAQPQGLLYQAKSPGVDTVMGLSAYPDNMEVFVQFVGSLRHTGFDGKIILGVEKGLSKEEFDYLESMDVTMYEIELTDCGANLTELCARGFEDVKLEWVRYELSRQWLRACHDCTGWTIVMDTRDAFFQANPFASLPDPSTTPYDLYFMEEIALHTCPEPHDQNPWRWYNIKDNWFYKPHTEMCYGANHWTAYGDRPVLCSGTTIGTRAGIDRFLSVMWDEFYRSNAEHKIEECRTPKHNDSDQWIMIYLYYHGRFGRTSRTRTIPWGTGPVNTVGHACINNHAKQHHSHADIVLRDNATGLILNNYEGTNSPARVAAVVHQFDRCHDWIYKEYVPQHIYMFSRNHMPKLSWKPPK